MAVPSQNNIAKTIKSHINEMNNVISIVVEAATSKTIKLVESKVSDIKKYQTIMSNIFDDKNGIVTMIINFSEKINEIKHKKLPNYRFLNRMTRKLFKYINSIADMDFDVKKLKLIIDKLNPVREVIDGIVGLFSSISKTKIPGVFTTKFLMIKLGLWRITKLGVYLTALNLMAPIMTASKVSLLLLDSITTSIFNVFNNISNTKIGIFTTVKIKLISSLLLKTHKLIRTVSIIGNYIRSIGGLKDALLLSAVFNMIESVFGSLKAIKIGVLFSVKLNRISRALLLINKIVRIINRIRVNVRSLGKIAKLQALITGLAVLFTTVILMSPIVILAMPALGILLLGMWTFSFIMRRIVRIIVKLAYKHTIKALLALLLITTVLTAISLAFMLIATVAEPVVKSTLWIIGLLGVISLITILLGGLGFLLGTFVLPLFPAIVIGLGMILVVIGIFFLMALALKVIQSLNLDSDKIRENCRIVIETTVMIIADIFKSDEEEDKKSEKSWIASIIDFIGGTLKTIIQAIMAVAFLAVMVVAILLILLIASQLRLIQEINLDDKLIVKNVGVVLDTCTLVIEALYNRKDTEDKESKKSWVASIIDFIGGSLKTIVQAIMALWFLALMVGVILMIVFIATELRLLQEINLDDTLIINNVSTVLDTCNLVIEALYNRKDKEDKESNKGWIASIINFIGGSLKTIVQAIMSLWFLALMIGVICLITFIAGQLTHLQEIVLERDIILKNVDIVLTTCDSVIDAIYNRDDKEDKKSNKGWIRKLFEWVGADGIINIIDAIMALAWLGMTVAMISMVHLLATYLNDINNIDLSGDIVGKVDKICNTADQISNYVTNRKEQKEGNVDKKKSKLLGWLYPKIKEIADQISRMRWVSSIISTVGTIGQIVDTIKTLNDLEDISHTTVKVKSICDTADEIAKMINSRSDIEVKENNTKLDFLNRINTVVTSLTNIKDAQIQRTGKAVGHYVKLINKIHKMDISKLETSAKLFEHMSNFSKSIKGDFSGLAESINEELMPMLERLETILNDVNKVFKETNNTVGQISQNTLNNTNLSSMTDQQIEQLAKQRVQSGNSSYTKSVDQEIKLLKDDRAQQKAASIEAKLDMLYDLFCGNGAGGSQYAIVKTRS